MRPINRLPQIWVADKNTIHYSAKLLQQNCYSDEKTELSSKMLCCAQTQQLSYFMPKQEQIIDTLWIESGIKNNSI